LAVRRLRKGHSSLLARHPSLFCEPIDPAYCRLRDRIGVKRWKVFVLQLEGRVEESDGELKHIHARNLRNQVAGMGWLFLSNTVDQKKRPARAGLRSLLLFIDSTKIVGQVLICACGLE
jgi:hypothetical protein